MNQALSAERMLDEFQVRRVRELWAFGRDLGDWDLLASCFHPEATITTSWYDGPACGFIERSRQMRPAMKPEERNRHSIGNMRVELNGARATLETDAQVQLREFFDGRLFDLVSHTRFYDLLEKRDGAWRILKASCMYDKDRLDPVVPGTAPEGLYAAISLEGNESGFAFLRWRQEKRGRSVPPGIVLGGSAGERALKDEGRRWLDGNWRPSP